jgi:hypothetical protein
MVNYTLQHWLTCMARTHLTLEKVVSLNMTMTIYIYSHLYNLLNKYHIFIYLFIKYVYTFI